MSSYKPKDLLEITANILVLIMAVSLVTFFVHKNYYPQEKSFEAMTLKKGTAFRGLEEVDFSNHPNTLILALSTKCPYCTQSIPFYKRLLETNKNSDDLRLIAIYPQPQSEIDRYLTEYNLQIKSIPDVKFLNINMEATPTLVWINSNKEIVRSWQGFLNKEAEDNFWDFYNTKLSPK